MRVDDDKRTTPIQLMRRRLDRHRRGCTVVLVSEVRLVHDVDFSGGSRHANAEKLRVRAPLHRPGNPHAAREKSGLSPFVRLNTIEVSNVARPDIKKVVAKHGKPIKSIYRAASPPRMNNCA